MKDGIHPNYETCTVKCACGATYETKQKLVDTAGRVDRFNRRYGKKN